MLPSTGAGSWITIAKVNDRRYRDSFEATIESPRAVLEDFLVITRHCWFIDLQNVTTGGLQIAQFRIDRGGNVHGKGSLVIIGFVEGAIDDGHRTRHGHFDWFVRSCFSEPQIIENYWTATRYFADYAWPKAFLFPPAINFLHALRDHVDSLKRADDVMDKTNASLLAVGDDIEADVFLIADAESRSV